ncbi:torsin-1A [Trichonephila clavipes]|nr:torsin-1A [Trichonephila clavipes]
MSYGFEPLTTGTYIVGALGLSIGLAGYKYVNCRHYECCDNQWVDFKATELEEEFKKNLFGQHLAKRVIPKAVNTHVLKIKPKKALVMSFHGWTGCGKNHVSRMIANHMFTKGSDSEYHHLYIGSRDFPHKQEVNKYRAGFRKCQSTNQQVVFLGQSIKDALDQRYSALALFVDFEAAFDKVWRLKCIQKLQTLGVCNNMLMWIRNFISQRFSAVRFGNAISSFKQSETGLPQGTVISPILFNIFINDLPDLLASDGLTNTALFADDLAI